MAQKSEKGRWRNWFGITDEQAMWRTRMEDDHSAFSGLVEKWKTPIHDLCFRMVGDPHLAQDLCQEAFSRIYEKRAQYRPESKFSTYLWRVALNVCYDELRRRNRRSEFSIDTSVTDDGEPSFDIEDTALAPDLAAVHDEDNAAVKVAMMKLPEIYRSVLVLKHYENLRLREIAEILDIPEGTVCSRMAEGLTQLGRLLKSHKSSVPRLRRNDRKPQFAL